MLETNFDVNLKNSTQILDIIDSNDEFFNNVQA